MIRKLRFHFVLVNMILATLVLLLIFFAFLSFVWDQQLVRLDTSLDMAAGLIPSPISSQVDTPPRGMSSISDLLPAFSVDLPEGGTWEDISQELADSDPEILHSAVDTALTTESSRGFLFSQHLRFLRLPPKDGTIRLAFVDTTSAEKIMFISLIYSTAVFLASFLLFFLISFRLSNIFLKPVKQAWSQQEQFIADASHELKTPISVIRANTELLLSHPGDTIASQHKWLEYTQQEVQRMQALVDSMLLLARADRSDSTDIQGTADLSELVSSCLLTFEPVLFEAGLDFSSQVEEHILLPCDPEQLRRLIDVLLDNAVKYTPAGGSVQVSLRQAEHKARLTVTNRGGPPISPEDQARIFERFYRADPSRARSQGGYGLGLAIAQSIAARHHGSISLESTPEKGTSFLVLLPLPDR